MNILSSFLVALGLSMDNLAVTVSAGCAQCKDHAALRWQISLLFALAHFVMFSAGFKGGELLHAGRAAGAWISFLILLLIGLHMIKNAFSPQTGATAGLFDSLRTQVALAVATSMDALFAGAGLALSRLPFLQTVLFLTACVLVTSYFGFKAGHLLGRKFGTGVEIAGGVVLMLVGVKVLLEGLGIW